MPILNWRELQYLNNKRQNGDANAVDTEDKPWLEGWDSEADDAMKDYASRKVNSLIGDGSLASRHAAVAAATEEMPSVVQQKVDLADEMGYGDDRRDYRYDMQDWINDPTDYRANSQTGVSKLKNGAFKFIPYAASTFIDNTVGLLDGLLVNQIVDAVDGDGEYSFGKSFRNTWTARTMDKFRDWSEKFAPNYRTQEETDDADRWWRHLNANFWGDTFLKNLGFTVGAGASAMVFSGASKVLMKAFSNKAYKAALAAANGDAKAQATIEEGFRKILQGEKIAEVGEVYDSLNRLGSIYKGLGYANNLIGATGGAIGESRVEAFNAAKEFRNEMSALVEQEMNADLEALYASVHGNDEYIYDDGERQYLTPVGEKYLNDSVAEIRRNYAARMNQIDAEAEDVARRVFKMNLPLLMGSNWIMFARMMSGGFKSQAKVKAKGNIVSGYKQRGTVGSGLLNVAKTSLSEGLEELSQKVFSEGAKDIAVHNMAAFHDGQYDKNAIKTVADLFMSMANSAGNVIADPTSWQEFAVGAMTGGLSSSVMGGFQEGRGGSATEREMAKSKIDAINARIADPEFKKLWRGLTRHEHYEQIKDRALDHKDKDGNADGTEFVWHTADDAQMISDVVMFAEIGKLNDLEDMVDSFANVSEDDAQAIRDDLNSSEDNDIKNKTDEELVNWVHKRADAVKKTIKQYRRLHDAIDYLAMGTTEDKVIQEMIYTRAQMEKFESRYQDILSNVMSVLRPRLQELASEQKTDGTLTERAQKAASLLASEGELETLFGGVNMDIMDRPENKQGQNALFTTFMDDTQRQRVLDELEDLGAFAKDPALKEQVKDMQRLVKARAEFYSKLYFPQARSYADAVNNDAKDEDDVVEELSEEDLRDKAKAIIDEVATASDLASYMRKLDEQTRGISLEELNKLDPYIIKYAGENPTVKDFVEQLEKGNEFAEQLAAVAKRMSDESDDFDAIPAFDAVKRIISGDGVGEKLLSDKPASEDNFVWIGKKLLSLVAGNTRAEGIVRDVLDEVMGDKARAAGLGKIDPEPDDGKGGEDGGKTPTQYELLNSALDTVSSFKDPVLEKILAGDFSDYPELSEEEKNQIMKKAITIRDRIKASNGFVTDTTDEEDDDMSSQNTVDRNSEARRKEYSKREQSAITATRTSAYVAGPTAEEEQEKIKKGVSLLDRIRDWGMRQGVKKRMLYSNKRKQAILDWLNAHNAQRFIDSGALMKLERAYREKGKRLQINFIANPHYVDNNESNNPFVWELKKKTKFGNHLINMVLAIEMNDENMDILKDYVGDVITDKTLLTVDDNGKAVKYQVIGEAWSPSEEEIKKKPESERPAYEEILKNMQMIWEHVVWNSIRPRYLADINRDSASFGPEGRWYVARQETHESTENEQENNPFVPGYSTEIKTSYTSGSGKIVTGKYSVSVDKDGFVKVKSSRGKTRRRISFEESGLTIDEILGGREEFGDPSVYDNASEEIKEDGLQFGDIVIRPDGKVSIEYTNITAMGDGVPIYDEDKARDIVAKVFPELIPALNSKLAGNNNTTVGEKIYTTLNYVMTGRNDTRAIGEAEYKKIPLRDSLVDYKKHGGEYFFAIPTGDGIIKSPGALADMPLGIRAKNGSLWMATRTANGEFSWTYVTVARTGEHDFQEDADPDSKVPINKALDAICEDLFANVDTSMSADQWKDDSSRRRLACKRLSDLFYFGAGNVPIFEYTDAGTRVIIGGEICEDKASLIRAIGSLNVRFQVDASRMEGEDGRKYLEFLINSGVLLSEMRTFERFGASVGVNMMSDKDDHGLDVPLHDIQDRTRKVEFTVGDESSVATREGITDVKIGEAGYTISRDGKVTRMTSRSTPGEEVTDPALIAEVKAMADILQRIGRKSGTTEPFNGKRRVIDKKLYKNVSGPNDPALNIPWNVEYIELYEKEVDGYVVRMKRVGRNGAVTPERDPVYWDAIWDYSMIFPQAEDRRFSEKTEEPPTEELMKQFEKEEAEKDGGTVAKGKAPTKKKTTGKGTVGSRTRKVADRKTLDRSKRTTTKEKQDEVESVEKDECDERA